MLNVIRLKGVLFGSKSVEIYDKFEMKCKDTGYSCKIEFVMYKTKASNNHRTIQQ